MTSRSVVLDWAGKSRLMHTRRGVCAVAKTSIQKANDSSSTRDRLLVNYRWSVLASLTFLSVRLLGTWLNKL